MSAPNLKEIEWAIDQLEHEESSKSGYILLAALYTVRNQIVGEGGTPAAHTAPTPDPLDQYGDSEFLQAVAGKDPAGVWKIIDELMDTMKAVNRRVYDMVLRKIGSA